FIYAFDNMGSERFTELASLLLASRYQGFLLGGAGSDGGIDAEIDPTIGELRPESRVPLIGELVTPADLVIFQFKHQVTARVGQGQSRTKLLAEFTCNDNASCDLHAKLIKARKPSVYVVVTNVEITPQFREKFIAESKAHNP